MGCQQSAPVVVAKPPEEPDPEDIYKKIHSLIRWNKNFDEVKVEVKNLNRANCIDPGNGNAPIHIASQNGHIEIVKLLIAMKADLNVQNKKGNTAMHMAVGYDYYDVAKLLLEAGADIEILNTDNHPGRKGIEGTKSLDLCVMYTAKTTADILAAFEVCRKNLANIDKAQFIGAGLKLKKQLGETAWTPIVQTQFKQLMDSFP